MRRLSVLAVLVLGCGSSPTGDDGGIDASLADTGSDGGSPVTDGAADATTDAPAAIYVGKCGDPIPQGAKVPPALPAYVGTCPTLAAAPAMTTISSSGAMRSFLVYSPATLVQGERLPLVFMWHWLGGTPDAMASKLEAQKVADAYRVALVIPAPKGDVLFKWPFEAAQAQARVDEEMKLFDDMLACVAKALPIDETCISSLGVSAGALFTAQLAQARGDRLASFVSLSGGVGNPARPWSGAPRALPGIVLWGGTTDVFPSQQFPVINFQNASKELEDGLVKDKSFFVECVHN
jgi:predicted esterase